MHDIVARVDHVQDRQAGLALADPRLLVRKLRFVIDDRVTGRRGARRHQPHLLFGQDAAIAPGAFGLDDDLAEETVADVAFVGVGAHRRAVALHDVDALLLGVQPVFLVAAGALLGEAVCILADVAAVVGHGVGGIVADQLHAVGVEARPPALHLLVDEGRDFRHAAVRGNDPAVQRVRRRVLLVRRNLERIGVGRQQVCELDRQAVARGHAQHEGTRALVGAQGHLAGGRAAADGQRHTRGVDDVALERENHPVDIGRAEPVEHQRLIDRDHLRGQFALTGNCSERLRRQQQRARCRGDPQGKHRAGGIELHAGLAV